MAMLIALSAIGAQEVYSASKRLRPRPRLYQKEIEKKSKKKSKKKGTRSKKKSSVSSKKKKTSRKKKGANRKKKSRKNNTINHKQYTPPVETPQNDTLTLLVNREVLEWIPGNLNPGGLRVNSVKTDNRAKTAKISLNENFTYLPVSHDLVSGMRKRLPPYSPTLLPITMSHSM